MSLGLDGEEKVENCSVSHLKKIQLYYQEHLQRLQITYQRSFWQNACGCLDTTLPSVFAISSYATLSEAIKAIQGKAELRS